MRVSLPLFSLCVLSAAFHSIVEFASQEDAQRAIRELSEVTLLGRPVFIREAGFIVRSSACDNDIAPGPRKRCQMWCNTGPGKNWDGHGRSRFQCPASAST